MAVLSFSHIALNCKDPLATERFYTQHFGFHRARVIPVGEEQIVFLRCGAVCLELFAAKGIFPGPCPEKDGPATAGVRHLAFQVDDVDAKLAEMGSAAKITLGPLGFDAFIPGWRTAWMTDPDGNIVEVSQGFQDEENPPAMEGAGR